MGYDMRLLHATMRLHKFPPTYSTNHGRLRPTFNPNMLQRGLNPRYYNAYIYMHDCNVDILKYDIYVLNLG